MYNKEITDAIFEIYRFTTDSEMNNLGLLTGIMGRILFYVNLHKFTHDKKYLEQAIHLLNDTYNDLERTESRFYTDMSFATGLSGLSFLLMALQYESVLELDIEDELVGIDEILYKECLKLIDVDGNDFLLGSIGILYALSFRSDRPLVYSYMENLIDALLIRVVNEQQGYSIKNHLFKVDDQVVNFSLSHGLCGIILVLTRVADSNIRKASLTKLITGLVDFMLYHKKIQPENDIDPSFFPLIIWKKSLFEPIDIELANNFNFSRLAWCYGDINQALALYKAGTLLKNKEWLYLSEQIGLNNTKRTDYRQTAIQDPFFCHGAAGVAQYYKFFLKLTKKEIYKKSYQYWISETIKLYKKTIFNNNGILEGPEGVGLVLISYLKPDLCEWEKAFLLY